MLTLEFETEKSILKSVYATFEICGESDGANFVFYDESKVVGLWRMRIEDGAGAVDKIIFADGVEEGDKNFFFRAMLYKFTLAAPMKLVIGGEHKELELFGFKVKDGNTEINTKNIDLHRGCASIAVGKNKGQYGRE